MNMFANHIKETGLKVVGFCYWHVTYTICLHSTILCSEVQQKLVSDHEQLLYAGKLTIM